MSVDKFNHDKDSAWTSLQKRWDCDHSETEIRRRVINGGGVQFVFQCLRCGKPMPGPIAKLKALDLCGGKLPQDFDDGLNDKWCAAYQKEISDHLSRFGKQEFFKNYSKYLRSVEWKEKREQVMQRAGRLCEGCRSAPADEVHHLTYEHVGHEFLFELVAVCHSCHERLHEDEQ